MNWDLVWIGTTKHRPVHRLVLRLPPPHNSIAHLRIETSPQHSIEALYIAQHTPRGIDRRRQLPFLSSCQEKFHRLVTDSRTSLYLHLRITLILLPQSQPTLSKKIYNKGLLAAGYAIQLMALISAGVMSEKSDLMGQPPVWHQRWHQLPSLGSNHSRLATATSITCKPAAASDLPRLESSAT